MSYIQPSSTVPVPRGLTLVQFIQTVIAGISDIPGPLVRPKWQKEPPKNPDIDVNWIAMGVEVSKPDANGYLDTNSAGAVISQRHETLEVQCQIYGPSAIDTWGLLRDGFQIPQNRYALTAGNMGFVEITEARNVPELVNERWLPRYISSVFLRREIQRVYPIVTLLSASGTIHTVLGNEQYLLDWETQT